ncbi:cullin-9-like isoform X2 [Dendropsophus ebraccatus]|uniref:cullin-9-like isoform X2 n=1 Tax=Dendropsophus ebraccatus TaxID=150705 RepID=UPI0038316502
MLVGERRNGNLLVQLGPKLQAQPEELLRQRWSVDGHVEYLIRWAVHNMEETAAGNNGATSQAENKSSSILMWMSAEEVYSNCPTLLGKRKPEGPGIPEEKTSGAPDEGALQEMTEDVRMLVQRAARQMAHTCGPDSSILNTIHVLSAYASIGSLAGVFRETGALDLLMKMLCNPEKQIRKNAGKMLRALASHDAGSRAHVLLSLSQQDGIEQHMDFESRFTLLQLFAETTSSEEHCICFDGIHLPQIPGKQLFSLVKRYLCVTSLLDQLSSDRPDRSHAVRLQRQYDFCMAMGSLICELVRVMGRGMEGHRSVHHRGGCFWCLQRLSSTCDYTFVQWTLQPGVTMCPVQDYKPTPADRQSQMDVPPLQIDGHTSRGHRHVLEKMMGAMRSESGTLKLRWGHPATEEGFISQGDWWELLFFIQQLNFKDQEKLQDTLTLLHMAVTDSTAQEVVRILGDHCHGRLLHDLQNSHLYTRFCPSHESPEHPGAFPSVTEISTSHPAGASPSVTEISTSHPAGASPSVTEISTSHPAGAPPSVTEISTSHPAGASPRVTEISTSHPAGAPPSVTEISTSHPAGAPPSLTEISTSHPAGAPPSVIEISTSHPAGAPPSLTEISTSHPAGAPPSLTEISTSHPAGAPPSVTEISTSHPAGAPPSVTEISTSDPAGAPPSVTEISTSHPAGAPPSLTEISTSHPAGAPPSLTEISTSHPAGAPPSVTEISTSHPAGAPPSVTEISTSHPAGAPPSVTEISTSHPAGAPPSLTEIRAQELPEAEDRKSDLKILSTLLLLEGLELSEQATEEAGSEGEGDVKISVESFWLLARNIYHDGWEQSHKDAAFTATLRSGDRAGRCPKEESALSDRMLKTLVELLVSQMKDRLVVVTCLQVTYVLMSKYDWRVPFATEGGVRAVLGCMQKHHSSAAIQHIGLAVLKVLTGVGSCDLRGSSRRYTLNPGDTQVMKEIFSSIGSAASGSATSLLRAIPGAISKLQSTEGCFSSVYNGLLVIRMLTDNHEALSEQLSGVELPAVLHSFTRNSNSMSAAQWRLLSPILRNCLSQLSVGTQSIHHSDVAPVQALQDMDVASLLSALQDVRLSRELLPSLERCVCDDAFSLPCDVSQILTDPDFFLQLLSSLEQLRQEKALQLCIYRILRQTLYLHPEEPLPWHQSIRPSVKNLTTHCRDKELIQEVALFLHSLASLSKDCAVLMCCLDTGTALKKVMERHGADLQGAAHLRDLLSGCEEPAMVYRAISRSVLMSCFQLVLEQIDDQRRHQQQIRVPFLAAFLRSLRQDFQDEHKEDKCWEKIEVSSNPHRAHKLTDGNPKSYWESSGSTGSHYINIFMHRGVVIRRLLMSVASEDSSYMPARVLVMGGENSSNISTELNAVNVCGSASSVVLLENATRFWPVVQVKIKRCQQGGIDTRVRGLEILGPKPTFWPVFKEQLCRRTFLFYTSRAHSWGQEICERKESLLQLFSRLNRALSHEQEFADRFLPDDEAAQALGRTCWEALISPLVKSITTSDDGGVSPLSWLLTRYLGNIQGAQRPNAKTSVFNSRVRRLTHLLVHVDTSPQDTAELKPPSKANGKSRGAPSPPVRPSATGWSSLAGMAQCWQAVVQKQVQRFLEMSWNDVDLAPRFCSMYRALRRAMDEMFGQQMRFLLSLRQGFCEGLLQLSFLTALHVTEQFARYIDQLITVIRADSADLRSLEQLQEFLDFVLFLSDLELANSFEHFYRHYLADRLLSLGPCWLENSVVDHIGICFPNRFPQQMLKNLQEAKDLQREEHLYRLQEHDRGVLSEEEEDKMVMEESSVLQDEGVDDAEVQISVLSPRCWAIASLCYLDDPSKYFPETLSSPLQHFTDFYTKSQAALGSHHTQSRRLQWTWLGNAEVQYGDLTLRVSTLQMFILLLFNQHQEVSIEHIEEQTGISGSFLVSSLDTLTGRTGILSHHGSTGHLYVNEVDLQNNGSQMVLDFSTRQNRRISEEMICTYEKRRESILRLVERIMREERQILMDRLLFRVLDGFQRESPPIPPEGCGAPIVQSCILQLLDTGVIYRKANNPFTLCYKVEPPCSVLFCPLTSHHLSPVPPQVSEFCSVRKVVWNIAAVSEQRPTFSTFRSIEKS